MAIGHAVSTAAIYNGSIVHAFTREVSLLTSFELPTIPSSTTASPFRHDRFNTLRHRRGLSESHPDPESSSEGTNIAGTRVRRMPASSPTGSAESGSLSLRTGRSPQVAPHLFSRKCNYHCWIRVGNGSPEGTSTLRFKRPHRRTSPAAPSTGVPKCNPASLLPSL